MKGQKTGKDNSELLHSNAECKLLCGGVAAGALLCGGDETGGLGRSMMGPLLGIGVKSAL